MSAFLASQSISRAHKSLSKPTLRMGVAPFGREDFRLLVAMSVIGADDRGIDLDGDGFRLSVSERPKNGIGNPVAMFQTPHGVIRVAGAATFARHHFPREEARVFNEGSCAHFFPHLQKLFAHLQNLPCHPRGMGTVTKTRFNPRASCGPLTAKAHIPPLSARAGKPAFSTLRPSVGFEQPRQMRGFVALQRAFEDQRAAHERLQQLIAVITVADGDAFYGKTPPAKPIVAFNELLGRNCPIDGTGFDARVRTRHTRPFRTPIMEKAHDFLEI
ncbi:hypothetical protein [Methylocystis parvus]|uniref:hypothetical protein n=1 Tax=Methylocystis parvus TaxID=134 RepID=UPI003C73A899